MLAATQRRGALSAIRDVRRNYGINLSDIGRAIRELKEDGTLTRDCDHAAAADLIIASILGDNLQISAKAGFDWDRIIELFIQLLPLILAIFGL